MTTLRTRFVTFSIEVVDLTDRVVDPLSLLMEISVCSPATCIEWSPSVAARWCRTSNGTRGRSWTPNTRRPRPCCACCGARVTGGAETRSGG
ncbi:hypothetical protein [Micromonospora sp. NPDC005203]|uniref:hypothetical protein n=1 Tax=Micromonospora sp. NPDC005203 TaxID=3364226 RepID=UPI0036BB20A0